MKKFVFLGPSLSLDEAKQLCPSAIFLPPARCGDILEVLKLAPSHLLLIDGFFEAVPAVWHKEILFVMTKNVIVMGASSMGALRASELHPFGMQGLGQVAEWYSDGTITRDDEVAVLHLNAEHHYSSLTEPLVNIRSTLNVKSSVFQSLQELPYRERFWKENMPAVNQKALDAIEALNILNHLSEAEGVARWGKAVTEPLNFNNNEKLSYTLYFKGLHQQVFCRAPTLPAEALSKEQRLLTQTRLFAPCYRELVKLAKMIYACDLLKAHLDLKGTLTNKLLPPSIRWPSLNYPEWLDAIVSAQIPYKAFLHRYFQQQQFMPSMAELKRKLTAWQKEEYLPTAESVMAWLRTHDYSQEAFEHALIFETLFDYMIDRGNIALSSENNDLPCNDYFAQAFVLSNGKKYLKALGVDMRRKNITFLREHQQDVGLLNALDFYRNEDLLTFLTSCE